ncbi:hypothetical protein HDK90DRAFT_40702 [Phyllosticta capitalensis]|uniref:Uncharacterized protein n=1 Tax=Phyllosticta capitalensis TaxID=121624 RepID=A0ABR1Z4T2_9PEZI
MLNTSNYPSLASKIAYVRQRRQASSLRTYDLDDDVYPTTFFSKRMVFARSMHPNCVEVVERCVIVDYSRPRIAYKQIRRGVADSSNHHSPTGQHHIISELGRAEVAFFGQRISCQEGRRERIFLEAALESRSLSSPCKARGRHWGPCLATTRSAATGKTRQKGTEQQRHRPVRHGLRWQLYPLLRNGCATEEQKFVDFACYRRWGVAPS